MSIKQTQVTGVILAGGQGRRMGGVDKGLIEWQGRPFIEHLLAALQAQVDAIIINANRNQAIYQSYGFPVISDQAPDYQGPLAGLAAAMHTVKTLYILTIPCDSFYLAPDFAARMLQVLNTTQAELVIAHDGEQLQPTYALVPITLLSNLEAFLARGERKLRAWYAEQRMATVNCSDIAIMFKNINTPVHYQALQEGRL
ncbi:molybdenum cofactor guanylyltransferase MobA [uncultured Thiothrix sp.]|uniref:molybdenum cofactor guanylyltransferase MobA n=1 Tax=uncultured Thiothrix sp. TaxID=223185 RepID=UPI0026036909|nr:molybdenum cofactor guanylyltransferase MobA [uncultured Thiothrix sp.]